MPIWRSAGIASVLWGFAALWLNGVWVRDVLNQHSPEPTQCRTGIYFMQCHSLLSRLCSCSIRLFNSKQTRGVTTSGLCRGELEGVVAGVLGG